VTHRLAQTVWSSTVDFDVDGILYVSAVDRGSGRRANMNVRAARQQLNPAQKEEAYALITSLEPDNANVAALLKRAENP
jgi:molecular chaperone DnaK